MILSAYLLIAKAISRAIGLTDLALEQLRATHDRKTDPRTETAGTVIEMQKNEGKKNALAPSTREGIARSKSP